MSVKSPFLAGLILATGTLLIASGQNALSAGATARGSRLDRVASLADGSDPQQLLDQIRQTQIPAPAPAVGQIDTTAPPKAAPAQSATSETDNPRVDESALRYFASRGDTARLQAEIARLKALYPTWQPPADPLAVPQLRDAQLEAMWRLYSESRYAEVRRSITDRQVAQAGWQPPADLLERLNVAEARVRLINASNLKQFDTVVSVGAETPSLLNCADVDVLWRVAEAFIKTDRTERGRDAYTFILSNCTNPQERASTLLKAAVLLPYEQMQPLLARERVQDGRREFDSVRDDLARSFVAEANRRPEITIDHSWTERLRALTAVDPQGNDALLLGWYSLRHNNMSEAEKWFRAARAKTNSASVSQGLALALIARNAAAEAEDIMYPWKGESEESTATYLATTVHLLAGDPPPSIAPAVLQRIAAAVMEQQYVPSAQQMGWYARAFNQPEAAIRWFETALSWKSDDEPSAYGLALTRQQLNDRAGTEEIRRRWAGKSERIANLGLATAGSPGNTRAVTTAPQQTGAPSVSPMQTASLTKPSAPAVYAEKSNRPAPVSTPTAATAKPSKDNCSLGSQEARSPQQALALGWCLMNLNRPLDAAKEFEKALASNVQSVREDATYGQSLAYLRLGLTNKAAIAATQSSQDPKRASELQGAILADRAVAAFNAKRYREALMYLDQRSRVANEPADLAVLRGYAYLNLGMVDDASKIFAFVAETGNRDASRGLADIRDMQNGYR